MSDETIKLSEHFTLAELCKTKTGIKNVPNEAQVENLRRVCRWLEELRLRYNLNKKEKIKNKDDDVAPLRSKANGESEEGENRRNYRLSSSAGWVMKVVAP